MRDFLFPAKTNNFDPELPPHLADLVEEPHTPSVGGCFTMAIKKQGFNISSFKPAKQDAD